MTHTCETQRWVGSVVMVEPCAFSLFRRIMIGSLAGIDSGEGKRSRRDRGEDRENIHRVLLFVFEHGTLSQTRSSTEDTAPCLVQ